MSPAETIPTGSEPPAWIELFKHPHRGPVAEAAFVLTAVDVPHQVLDDGGYWQLWVPAADAPRAQHQIMSYWQENQHVAQRPPQSPAVDSGLIGILGYLLVIWSLPWLQSIYFGPWQDQGVMAAGAVMGGQWWRCITALTLHSDIGHIVSNSAFGLSLIHI